MRPLPSEAEPPAPPALARGVIHVVDATMFWSPTGGGVRRYLTVKKAVIGGLAGWRHTIVAPGAVGSGAVDCGGWPLPFSGGYKLPWRRNRCRALLAALRPDVIEVGDPFRLAWAALDAGQALGVPVVAFCHSSPVGLIAAANGGAAARWARRAAERYLARLYRQFDCVLAPSRALQADLIELGIDRVEHQALGVSARTFHPRFRDTGFKRSLGLAEDTRLLLYVGRFAPEKNLPLLVAAVRALGPPYHLLAVGAGPTPPRGERVLVLPHEHNDLSLARIYASADALVHAGDQETFGLAALEAMASGTPLVVRGAAGLAEFAAGGAALAVGCNSVDAWAGAIAGLFAAPAGATRAMTTRARQRAESLDWERVMGAITRRYLTLTGRRASPQRRCA